MVLQRHSVVSRFKISLFEARFHADKMASEETQKKKRRTGDMCSLSFCSKRLKDNVSIHKPPKDPEIRKKWWKTRENVSKLNTACVCSDHFTEDDYPINPSSFGLLTTGGTGVRFRGTLKRGIVPSIYPTLSEEQLFQKEKQLRAAKSRGISIPKTARSSVASVKKDKSGESKIKRKHVIDKLVVSWVST